MARKEMPNMILEIKKTQNNEEGIKIIAGAAEEVVQALKKMKELGEKTVSGIYVFEGGEKSERKIDLENLNLEKATVTGNFISFEIKDLPIVKAQLEFKGIVEIKKIETNRERKIRKQSKKSEKQQEKER